MVLNFLCTRKNDSSTKAKRFGTVTIAGHKKKDVPWINQDNFLIEEDRGDLESNAENDQKSGTILAVFDGHGPDGHLVSTHCKERILSILDNNTQCVEKSFEKLQEELEEKDYASCSGTTCALIMLSNGSVEAYNVGDSQAFLGVRKANGKLEHIPLTTDHKPSSDTEASRITSAGGEIYSKRPTLIVGKKKETKEEGPVRAWYTCEKTNKTIGLAMTRSLGDWSAHKVGLSCKPTELKRTITNADEFIVLCSDGVTDVLSPKGVTALIDRYMSSLPPDDHKYDWDPQEAAKMIVDQARRRWEQCAHIDDITCTVIKLCDNRDNFFMN
jgi:serine/threonine protein phosphatase PrpC